jgi:hypothetical protein
MMVLTGATVIYDDLLDANWNGGQAGYNSALEMTANSSAEGRSPRQKNLRPGRTGPLAPGDVSPGNKKKAPGSKARGLGGQLVGWGLAVLVI